MATYISRTRTAPPKSRLSKMSSSSTINNGTKKASFTYMPRQEPAINDLERRINQSTSPQENDQFKVPPSVANGTNVSNKTLPYDENSSMKKVDVDNAKCARRESNSSYWTPSMDGIIQKTNENILQIIDALYGPGRRPKLPVFEEWCRE